MEKQQRGARICDDLRGTLVGLRNANDAHHGTPPHCRVYLANSLSLLSLHTTGIAAPAPSSSIASPTQVLPPLLPRVAAGQA